MTPKAAATIAALFVAAFVHGFDLALYAVECDVAARLAAWDRAAIDATCTERPA